MTASTIDVPARRTAQLSRRRTLLTLGGVVMAASTAAAVEPGLARKRNNKSKKNSRKGKGADCQKREQQRCSTDTAACRATAQVVCNANNLDVEQCLAIRACCEECSAGGLLACVSAAQQV